LLEADDKKEKEGIKCTPDINKRLEDPTTKYNRIDWMYEVDKGEDGGEGEFASDNDEEEVDEKSMESIEDIQDLFQSENEEKVLVSSGRLDGIVWESNVVLDPPIDLPLTRRTELKPNMA